MSAPEFDAIVIGSGMTGGIAAKYLCEAGLKVLVVERGRHIDPASDYLHEFHGPWDVKYRGLGNTHNVLADRGDVAGEYNEQFFASSIDAPYQVADGKPFVWVRGYQLGGRSLIWGRHVPRWSPANFEANAKDGHGVDWPIRYADVAPWYDKIESYIGVAGQAEGLEDWPDGKFLPPFPLNPAETHLRQELKSRFGRTVTPGRNANLTVEHLGRGPCRNRDHCGRGCSFKGYYCSVTASLPDAAATGNLTVMTDSIGEHLLLDKTGSRAESLQIVNATTGARRRVTARLFVACAGSFNSVQLLLNSRSEAHPRGIGAKHDVLGRYIMDHVYGAKVTGILRGFEDRVSHGRKPTGMDITPFANVGGDKRDYLRTYYFQGGSGRLGWGRGSAIPGIGRDLKEKLTRPGPWIMTMGAWGDMLPRPDNRLTLSKLTDRHGIPQLHIDFSWSDNERRMMTDAAREARAMFEAAGLEIVSWSEKPGAGGLAIHEMGGAPMGRDPQTSVLNAWNQVHDVPNILVTDGAAMASSGCQNPSITYMALTARACTVAIERLKTGAA